MIPWTSTTSPAVEGSPKPIPKSRTSTEDGDASIHGANTKALERFDAWRAPEER